MSIWSKIIEGVTGPVADYFVARQKLKYDLKVKKLEGDIKIEEAKANMKVKQLESDSNWELQQIANSGWKDEYVLVLLSIPLILAFIPSTVTYVMMGFAALAQTPEWYRWLIMLVFTAIYGIRIWRRKIDG